MLWKCYGNLQKSIELCGFIVKHNKFSDWVLDIKVKSNRFLALDTKDSEDAAYFGTAFIDDIKIYEVEQSIIDIKSPLSI